jgi:hypothetical protein
VEAKATYSVIPYLGRDLPEAYRNMILAKWLRTLRFGNDFFRLIDSSGYFSSYQEYIKRLLMRPQCIVRLAVLSDDPDVCLGFSVSEPEILHYCWCHKDNRKIGVGKALTQFPFKYVTHLTTAGMAIWNKKYPNVIFNPFK